MPLKIEIDINEAKEMIAAQASIKYNVECTAEDIREELRETAHDANGAVLKTEVRFRRRCSRKDTAASRTIRRGTVSLSTSSA